MREYVPKAALMDRAAAMAHDRVTAVSPVRELTASEAGSRPAINRIISGMRSVAAMPAVNETADAAARAMCPMRVRRFISLRIASTACMLVSTRCRNAASLLPEAGLRPANRLRRAQSTSG